MKDNPIRGISTALRDSGIGIYRIEEGTILKAGGHNQDGQAWYGVSVRIDRDEAFIVELELTLDHHLAASAAEAEADLRNHFEEVTDEPYDLSPATIDPVWGHWRCTVSRRCHSIDEAVELVRDMLEWEF